MKAIEIRNKYLAFFEKNGHKIIPGAPLVPENDPTVLFTTAGMHPLVPYLSGEKHPSGTRLTDYQKCLRTDDIDEVGDPCHLTFFEMLGNWSLGDYFKEEAIRLSFKFLTEELEIPVERLSVTCFEGDQEVPRDTEAAAIWESVGIPKERIYFNGRRENWWGPAGQTGPCGPDTEMFYDTGKPKCSENCNPSCNCGKYVEIWNDVFMQYNKTEDGKYEKLSQRNVDTGLGLERATYLLQGKNNAYETEIFAPIIEFLQNNSEESNIESLRIVAEHMRASIMLICDKVLPSNVEQGYILRRLIRRSIRHLRKIKFNVDKIDSVVESVIDTCKELYPEVIVNHDEILAQVIKEKNRFMNTLVNGEKEFNRVKNRLISESKNVIDGDTLFRLYDTFGFPPEVTKELASENGFEVDMEGFKEKFAKHQELSRAGAEQKFKCGLADNSEETVKYHTVTHLLHRALKDVLGEHVSQKGSNITAERLRFDFSNPAKVEREDLDKVEAIINEKIALGLEVKCEEMSKEAAKQSGAVGLFEDKYGDVVKVYSIGDYSKEICGGPHVDNTSKLGKVKIIKEEAVSSGVRRVKVVFEK
ncbi:MAG: alanine--tRNA ligase [Clostridia bacterium]|nr:alanine--tRNA ligase [Clostridia bacterium]